MNSLGKVLRLLLLAALGAVLGAPPASAGMALPEHVAMSSAGATMSNASTCDPCCESSETLNAPCEHPSLCAVESVKPKFASVAGHGFAVASSAGHGFAERADAASALIPPDLASRLPGRKLSILFCSFQI